MADIKFTPLFNPIKQSSGPSSSGASTTFRIDAANERWAAIFCLEEDVTITQLGYAHDLTTGTPVQHRIGLWDLTTGGLPNAVLGGGTPASATFTPPADTTWNDTFRWITLDNAYAATAGFYAIVVEPVGTPDGSNYIDIHAGHNQLGARSCIPYYATHNGTSWGKQSSGAGCPPFGYRSASRTYGIPWVSFFTGTFSSNTTAGNGGDERGIKFRLPAGMGDTKVIRGFQFIGKIGTAARDFDVTLYEGTTSRDVLGTIDSDVCIGDTGFVVFTYYFPSSSLYTASFGTDYILAIKPNATGHDIALYGINVQDAQDVVAFNPHSVLWVSREDAGAWDETMTTRVPLMWPIYGDMTEQTGGGGGGKRSAVVNFG